MVKNDWDYPNRVGLINNEKRNAGTFTFTFTQPLLKPSDAKHELANSSDDLKIARLEKVLETASLKKEVVEAFFGVLRSEISIKKSEDQLKSAQLKIAIDSMKLIDGLIAEEDWLETNSELLDAELSNYEALGEKSEKVRNLNVLLDSDVSNVFSLERPEINNHPDDSEIEQYINRWQDCIEIKKENTKFDKADRAADYASSSHGLTADISANYGLERGDVEIFDTRFGTSTSDLETDSWGVSLNFTFPLWDGGASGASVKAARLAADQARLEFEKAQKSSRSEIVSLTIKLSVSYRKLSILQKKIETAKRKLDIAQSRLDDGQISMLTFLENHVTYLEEKDKYLEEMMNYFLTRFDLEGMYTS